MTRIIIKTSLKILIIFLRMLNISDRNFLRLLKYIEETCDKIKNITECSIFQNIILYINQLKKIKNTYLFEIYTLFIEIIGNFITIITSINYNEQKNTIKNIFINCLLIYQVYIKNNIIDYLRNQELTLLINYLRDNTEIHNVNELLFEDPIVIFLINFMLSNYNSFEESNINININTIIEKNSMDTENDNIKLNRILSKYKSKKINVDKDNNDLNFNIIKERRRSMSLNNINS